MTAHSVDDDEQPEISVGDEPVLVSWPDAAWICCACEPEIHE
jgi:hypothetical protein